MAKRYDPIMCMMVDDSVKTNDELSLAQKKQVVTELKGFLKKSYNFSDESEYARAYEDIRQMFTTGSRKSISGLFENAIKKTGAHDSASVIDRAIKTADGMFSSIFGKYSSAAKQHYDRAVKELDSFKGEIKDYLTLAGKWEMQIRNDLARIDEAYEVAGNDYYAARREIKETMDSLTQVMLRKAREKQK